MFDDTDLKHYMKENQDQKLISGLIYIDNYEDFQKLRNDGEI